jgi:protein TonB
MIQPQLGGKKVDVRDFMPKLDIAKSVQERAQKEKEFDRDAEAINIKKAQQAHQAQQNQMMTKPGQAGGQASQSLDYIKELDSGLETLLSTREFVFYTYYSRIRKQLNQYWGPKVREKLVTMYRQGRQIASSDDKITKCLITLDSIGNLARVQIIGNSGVRELDEAAVDAFKSAAPFPNPPKGIQDQDGNIKIRWDFVLEI